MILIAIICFSLYSYLSIEAVHFSPCAKWNTLGITVFGGKLPGNASNQLNVPQGMFLQRDKNSLYVADTGNRRIQMFQLDQPLTAGVTVASNIDSGYAIYVDDDDLTMYVALRFENRVEKWMKGASSGEQVGDQCKQCRDVWLDRDKNIYMTESGSHSILRWSLATSTSTIVAGRRDEIGHSNDRLYFPTSIYLNRATNTLYVADTMNNRIQKWNSNSQKGSTIAGSKDGISGNDAGTLANPLYVWIDEVSDTVYIVDTDNERIQRWLPNQQTGTTIAGGAGTGDGSNQLKSPTSLAFDNSGNLYVCDSKNHRIQMYSLIENSTCPINHSHSLFTKTTTTTSIFVVWLLATASRSYLL